MNVTEKAIMSTTRILDDRQPPSGAREITQEEFFNTVGKLDVHPTPTGTWPYLSVWKHRCGRIAGWSKSSSDYSKKNLDEKHRPRSRYYVP